MLKTLNMVLFLAGPVGVVILAWKGGAKFWTLVLGAVMAIALPVILLSIPAGIYMRMADVSRSELSTHVSSSLLGILHFAVLCGVVYGWYRWSDDQ